MTREIWMSEIDLSLYKSVVESANDAVIVTTPELNAPGPLIVYVNPAFTRMTGWTTDEIEGKTPRVLQGPRTERALLDRLRRDLATQRSFHGEGINYRRDGSEYFVEWRIAPVEDDGKVFYWVAIQRDVTTRKRTEDRLREDNQRKDTFLAMLAHELRNPLAPIRNSIRTYAGELGNWQKGTGSSEERAVPVPLLAAGLRLPSLNCVRPTWKENAW